MVSDEVRSSRASTRTPAFSHVLPERLPAERVHAVEEDAQDQHREHPPDDPALAADDRRAAQETDVIDCAYLGGLADLGLGRRSLAREAFGRVLALDPSREAAAWELASSTDPRNDGG